MSEKVVYGYCPICGDKGINRERRLNGYDMCLSGHKYLSSKAVMPQTEKVEDSGSEADFGTKDKEDSWEDEIGDVLYECCRSPYHDIAFEKIAPIIKSLLETEKKKAEARGFNTLLATSGCYSFEQTKQLIEAEKKKAVEEVLEYVNKENWHYVDYEKLKAKYKK